MTKVPTRTSIRRAAPWSGRSRRKTAWARGMPIQTMPEHRHPHRDRRAVAVTGIGGEGEEDREGRGEDQQHRVGGAEVGGDDQRRHRHIGRDRQRTCRSRHLQVLAQAEDPDHDRRQHEDDARRDDDRRSPRRRPGSRRGSVSPSRRRHRHVCVSAFRLVAAAPPFASFAPFARFPAAPGALPPPHRRLLGRLRLRRAFFEHLFFEEVAHQRPPKRRWRSVNAPSERSNAARSKSGHSSSANTSSEYAHCHSR